MILIDKIKRWIKGVLRINTTEIGKIPNTQIPNEVSSHLDTFVPLWGSIYKGSPPWEGDVCNQLGAAKVLCEYLASYNTAEMTIVVSDSIRHKENTECPAQSLVDEVLKDNNFWIKFIELDEKKEALGGVVVKPYNINKAIVLDYVNADSFIPTSFNNRRVTEGIFIDKSVKGEQVYRRLEIHKMKQREDKTFVTIENKLFVVSKESQDKVLGTEVSLSSLPEYENLLGYAEFEKDTPLFEFFPTAITNNKNNSPMGISRFANSIDTLKNIDIAYNELCAERERTKSKLIVPSKWFTRTINDDGTAQVKYDEKNSVYQMAKGFNTAGDEKPFAFSPDYRVEEYIKDINANLNLLCLQTGLSSGSISFDEAGGIKTATEVRSENSKTFKTVSRSQVLLKQGLEGVIGSILFLATHDDFRLLPKGDFEIKVNFDDSITPDRETHIKEGVLLKSSNLLSVYSFLTEYRGMTDEQAKQEKERIAEDNPTVPAIFGGE